jgi:periplasmic divalent cation tolerance protein
MSHIIILTTCPDETTAHAITRALIEQRLAACVSSSKVHSTYEWQGKIEEADELRLEIKTRAELYGECQKAIRALHTDAVPQIIATPITAGFAPYLDWIDNTTKAKQ